ncbi:MAG: hypothetical protein HC841_04920, partial [Verrucomicrobiae bacterium]|nr:hypothetical protein [Verrucomicrobiae bacterium]
EGLRSAGFEVLTPAGTYFILTDIFECPNLSSRAAMAARTAGLWVFLGRGGLARADYGPAAYWLASYAYRWVTFGAILILAFDYDERAGLVVLAVTASMLIVRPLLATVAAVRVELTRPAESGVSGPLFHRPALAIVAIGAVLFVPVDYGLVVEGRAENPAMRNIYAETPGVVTAARPKAAAGDRDADGQEGGHVIMRVDNPELALREKVAAADLELAQLGLRQMLASDPERQGAQRERVAAARKALDEVRAEMARSVATLRAGETWHPDPKVQLDGAWTTPSQRRVLGIVLPNSEPVLKAEIEQDALDLAGGDIVGRRALVQVSGAPQRSINANVVSVLEVAQQTAADGQPPKRAFEITLKPVDAAVLPQSLRLEGKRFEARIDRPWSSLAARVWDWLGRLTQKRFASSSRN